MKKINWKYEIGNKIIDYKEDGTLKRDLTVIDRKAENKKRINKYLASGYQMSTIKYYKYRCNICGWDGGWMEERHLYHGKQGCSCCRGLTVVKGINDIATTNPDLVKYFKNQNEAFLYSAHSDYCPELMCPDCGFVKTNLKLDTLTKYGFGCQACSDGVSYNEKFIHSLLRQLGIEYKSQLSRTTCKWCDKYYYDFYFQLNDKEYIFEVNGQQHYMETFSRIGGRVRTLKEEQENDLNKKELAYNNGFNDDSYIVLDCRNTNLEWIKQSVLSSNLNMLFDLSNINWSDCDKNAVKNLTKEVCQFWETVKGTNVTLKDIGKIFGLSQTTISTYLTKGKRLNWCTCDALDRIEKQKKERQEKERKRVKYPNGKRVVMLDNKAGVINIFRSANNIEKTSIEIFSDELKADSIHYACTKKKNHFYKGYYFWYLEDYIKEFGEDSLPEAS